MDKRQQTCIDHLVVGCYSLNQGLEYVKAQLGALAIPGGHHIQMGTHNVLLKLGQSLYLEIIAIDPTNRNPGHKRWFEMDLLGPDIAPRLLTWVARTNDIYGAAQFSGVNWGRIKSMSRNNLDWLITIPENGSMPMKGIAPTLIQWKTTEHPAGKLRESGCSLIRIEGFHPDAGIINEALEYIGFSGALSVKPTGANAVPLLLAHFETMNGPVTLSSYPAYQQTI
jgi:hypothetical protein